MRFIKVEEILRYKYDFLKKYMKRIKVTHYLQDPSCCAIAACATVANYYNEEIDYDITKKLVIKKKIVKEADEGLESSQSCMLLNELGFYKTTTITSILSVVDYQWANLTKSKLIKELEISKEKKKDKDERNNTRLILKLLKNKDYNNNLIINYNFGKYIRKYLNQKKPVILSFNWTMFHKFSKDGKKGVDPYNGEEGEHAVVANGYDNKGVWIVDSHHQYYKYKRKKYRRGFYKISWENLMTCMSQGDVIIPDDYVGVDD